MQHPRPRPSRCPTKTATGDVFVFGRAGKASWTDLLADVGQLDGVCGELLELAAPRPARGFAARYHGRRTIPGVLPRVAPAAAYLIAVHQHLEERIG
jgi:hypothetical protein